MRLRGFAFPIKEAHQADTRLPADYLPLATEISLYLSWGATAVAREATRLEGADALPS